MVVAIILGLLALFSLISLALGTDDGRRRDDTREGQVHVLDAVREPLNPSA